VVRVATELSAAQRQRLLDALTAAYGRGVHMNLVHDPTVVGGVSVQIGDELIDGTAASRLAEVRRRLAG
jgi:F-type H+-transporting ATPase subunit delta